MEQHAELSSRRGVYPRSRSWAHFPSVPHLAPSGSEAGDVVLSSAELVRVLSRPLRVYEKLDGLNVGIRFSGTRELGFVSRGHGLVRPRQLGPGMWPLLDWAVDHFAVLWRLLGSRYVLFGEWLQVPRRLPYPKMKTPFFGLVLFDRSRRAFLGPSRARPMMQSAGLVVPPLLARGRFDSLESLLRLVRQSRLGGPGEGVVVEQGDRLFKAVRPEYLFLPVVEQSLERLAAPLASGAIRPVGGGTFSKSFEGRGLEAADREAAFLKAMGPLGLSPSLVARPNPATVVMTRLGGRPFPAKVSAELASRLGQVLRALHRNGPQDAWLRESAPASPSEQARAAASQLEELARRTASPRRSAAARSWARAIRTWLLPLLTANSRGLSFAASVPCHGDLQPANLRLIGKRVVLLDFERAVLGDPAWELACAGDRLELGLPAREGLRAGYGVSDATLCVRAQLFRLVSSVSLPASVLLANETPNVRRPGTHAQRLARKAAATGRDLLQSLTGRVIAELR